MCLQGESTTLYTVILTIHTSIVYSLIGVTESVDEPTEVVGLAGSPPAEDGCVQMLSSVTEDKLSEVSNGVNISCRFLVSVNVYLLVPNTSISLRYKRPVAVMLILRYFPRANVVRFITTGVVPSSLKSENIVLSVLVGGVLHCGLKDLELEYRRELQMSSSHSQHTILGECPAPQRG